MPALIKVAGKDLYLPQQKTCPKSQEGSALFLLKEGV